MIIDRFTFFTFFTFFSLSLWIYFKIWYLWWWWWWWLNITHNNNLMNIISSVKILSFSLFEWGDFKNSLWWCWKTWHMCFRVFLDVCLWESEYCVEVLTAAQREREKEDRIIYSVSLSLMFFFYVCCSSSYTMHSLPSSYEEVVVEWASRII